MDSYQAWTDLAMILAMADVYSKRPSTIKLPSISGSNLLDSEMERLCDRSRNGKEKTPEWAEAITGVPADTTRALARLYAQSKPAKLHSDGR